MKQLKWITSIVLITVIVFTSGFSAYAAADFVPSELTNLSGYTVIIHTNDTHSRAAQDLNNGMLGFTAVSALKKKYERIGASVILLDAGDSLHGLPFANMVKGESIVQIMNDAGYDAMAPGNHDFNYSTDRLVELSKKMNSSLLSANVTKKADGEPLLKKDTIIEKNGVKYGIFGLSTPETAYKTNPENVKTVDFTSPVTAARNEVTSLKNAGAQVVIAVSHLGLDKSSEYTSERVAKEVSGIDMIVDGHSHTVLENGLKVGNTLIVQTGEYIKNIGVVIIDPKGNKKAGLVNKSDYQGIDSAIVDAVAKYTDEQKAQLSDIVGKTTVDLDGARENVRTKETNFGDFVADAMRSATKADIAITNGGGIRTSIKAGNITMNDLVTVFPFGNYIVTKKITGKALIEALELSCGSYPSQSGGFLQVSGITYSFDQSKPKGSRVTSAAVNGKAVNPKAEYLLATNDYLSTGGDGYTMLKDFKELSTLGTTEEILKDYLKANGDVKAIADNRITMGSGKALTKSTANNPNTGVKDYSCLYVINFKLFAAALNNRNN